MDNNTETGQYLQIVLIFCIFSLFDDMLCCNYVQDYIWTVVPSIATSSTGSCIVLNTVIQYWV